MKLLQLTTEECSTRLLPWTLQWYLFGTICISPALRGLRSLWRGGLLGCLYLQWLGLPMVMAQGPCYSPFITRLLVHRPCDVGQDARPIHNGSGLFAPIPCGGDRPKKCAGTPPAPLCWPWTTDRPISRFSFLTLRL
jgi:hypothetical protein